MHTPNWNQSLDEETNRFVISDESGPIAIVVGSRSQFAANAALISAAPKLLRACRMILGRLDLEARDLGEDAVFLGNALRPTLREAIAEATGEV